MKGITVCFFGTTYMDTYNACIKPIFDYVKNEYGKEYEVEMAFTSRIIKKRLKERGVMDVKNEKEALDYFKSLGIEEPIVFSTHLLEGIEYEKILSLKEFYPGLRVSKPLFADKDAINEFTKKAIFPEDECTVWMGHGTSHEVDDVYDYCDECFKKNGGENVFVATVEGRRSLETILPELEKFKDKKITLRPMMLVSGDHAKNDMAGDEPDSWKSILTQKGFKVEAVLKGLGEYDFVREMLYERLKEVL